MMTLVEEFNAIYDDCKGFRIKVEFVILCSESYVLYQEF